MPSSKSPKTLLFGALKIGLPLYLCVSTTPIGIMIGINISLTAVNGSRIWGHAKQ
jgi:hypothetical protein